jgi:predicted nucleic acid-binding Zn ribbon protein
MKRIAPRALSHAIEALAGELAPQTPLARVQAAWAEAVGPANAAEATPVALRGGRLSVYCAHSAWAENLQLMGPRIAAQVNGVVGEEIVHEIRCTSRRPRGG